MQAGENLLQGRGVEAFLVLEVVIEQSFVDAGAAGNLVRARSGHAFMGKLFQRGLEDGGAGLFRLTAGA